MRAGRTQDREQFGHPHLRLVVRWRSFDSRMSAMVWTGIAVNHTGRAGSSG
jgi:hypothetical protein